MNLEFTKIGNHGHIELKDLYHERVKIPNRRKEQIWGDNKIKMKAQTMANLVPILVVLVQSLLHQDNIGISYARTSNFRMELVTFMPILW